MALFRRKQPTGTVLPEVEKYYEAERRERSGLAWILALVSVACVVLALIGLFIGSRWLYHRVTKPKQTTSEVAKTNNNNDQTKTGTDSNSDSVNTPNTQSTPAPAATSTPPATSSTSTTTPAPAATTPSPTPTPAATTPASNQKLANTGPASTAIYFVIASILSTLLYRIKILRSSEN